MKKTIVLGATPNSDRYAYQAVALLAQKGHEVIPVGIRKGNIDGIPIQNGMPMIENVHTITLYINEKLQSNYYDYIFSLKPKRLIFNPGTENATLMQFAQASGMEVEIGCTLVLLRIGVY
jgi:predicted CoA-binding protein